MPGLIRHFMSYANPTGAEPVPDSALINDTQNLNINVEPGKTYMFRIVNMAAFAAQYLWFEDHTMRIVEVDGVYTEPAEAKMIYLTPAQRYSVLITTKNDTSTNFAIVGSMDQVNSSSTPSCKASADRIAYRISSTRSQKLSTPMLPAGSSTTKRPLFLSLPSSTHLIPLTTSPSSPMTASPSSKTSAAPSNST